MQALGAMRYERAIQGAERAVSVSPAAVALAAAALDALAHIGHPSSVPHFLAQLDGKNRDASS